MTHVGYFEKLVGNNHWTDLTLELFGCKSRSWRSKLDQVFFQSDWADYEKLRESPAVNRSSGHNYLNYLVISAEEDSEWIHGWSSCYWLGSFAVSINSLENNQSNLIDSSWTITWNLRAPVTGYSRCNWYSFTWCSTFKPIQIVIDNQFGLNESMSVTFKWLLVN